MRRRSRYDAIYAGKKKKRKQSKKEILVGCFGGVVASEVVVNLVLRFIPNQIGRRVVVVVVVASKDGEVQEKQRHAL